MKNKYLQETKKKLAQYKMIQGLCEIRKRKILQLKLKFDCSEDEIEMSRLKKEINRLEIELLEDENIVFAIEKGLAYLSPVAQKIVELKYIQRESWIVVGLTTGYGQSRCKEIGKESLLIIGECLYGLSVHQDLPLVIGQGYY